MARIAQLLPADELDACRRAGAAFTYDEAVDYALARLELIEGRAVSGGG